MTPIDTYKTYLALKNHFTKDQYDYHKYCGKVKAQLQSFYKRKDRYWFERLSRQKSDTEIVDIADLSMYVMTSEYGASTQLEKINMLDLADIIVLNKFEKRGALDAYRDIRKQYKRNHQLWDVDDDALRCP